MARPTGAPLREAVRLLPDTLRLVARLARDRSLPRAARLRLWLALAYLSLPFDLIPDFIPVVGYVDDVIVVALALRSLVRAAGHEAVRRQWPGTEDGLTVLLRLAGVAGQARPGPARGPA